MAILISTPQDLDNIRNDLSATYKLTNDIDMSDWGNFEPIGTVAPFFEGTLDGNGYVIKNLHIVNNAARTGLFGLVLASGIIKNLGLVDAYVESNDLYLGGMVGYLNGAILNCFVTGTIVQTDSTKSFTGGIAGQASGVIENSYTDCNVSGFRRVGGFFGYGSGSGAKSYYNYSRSQVSGNREVGGFYGAINTNSAVTPSFYSNYFDSDIAGTTDHTRVGVTAKTTAEMKQQTTYSRWDFDEVWEMDNDYPTLRVFSSVPSAKQETFLLESFISPIVSKSDRQVKSKKNIQSHIEPILSNTQRHTATLRNIHTYISNINTSVSQSHRSVRASTAQVDTFIKPIHTMVHRKANRTQSVTSHISPLWSSTSVLVPLSDKVVNAYLSWLENPSRATHEVNNTATNYIENPTLLEVVE